MATTKPSGTRILFCHRCNKRRRCDFVQKDDGIYAPECIACGHCLDSEDCYQCRDEHASL